MSRRRRARPAAAGVARPGRPEPGRRVTPTARWWPFNERRTRGALVALLGLGLLVRLIHFATLAGTPYARLPLVLTQTDAHATWRWAETILAGDLLGRETYHPYMDWMREIAPLETWYGWWGGREIFQQSPLYAYWVATLLGVSGRSLAFVLFVQLVVGALTPLVVFALARRLFADRQVSLLAAALTALYGPLVFYQGTLLRDWLPPLIEPLALVALLRAAERDRSPGWLAAGALVGLALLVKETALLLLPVALLWIALEHRGALARAARAGGILVLGFGLALAPLVLRNVLVGAPPLAVSNRGADALIEGNAADGTGLGMTLPASMRGILERSGGRFGAVIRGTLATYDGDWRRFAELQFTKMRALAAPFEIPNNLDFYYGREISPILRVLPGYGVLFPLAVAGFFVTLVNGRRHRLLALYAAGSLAGLAGGPVLARYRIVLVPVMAIYGAAGLVQAWDAARRRETRRWAVYASLVAGVAAVQQVAAPVRALQDIPAAAVHAIEYGGAAQLYAAAGRYDRALAEIERLRRRAAQNPRFTALQATAAGEEVEVRTQWAGRLIDQRRLDQARQQVDAAARLADTYPVPTHRLANLGLLYGRLGEPRRAATYLRRFLELEPDGPDAARVRQVLSRLGAAP